MPLALVTILIEREREREVAFLVYAFDYPLMLLGSPIFCRIGQFYHFVKYMYFSTLIL